jgi:hypothetical protein
VLNAAAGGVQYQRAYRARTQKKGLTEEHQRHAKHVEQSQRGEDGRGVEHMVASVDGEGENPGQDG